MCVVIDNEIGEMSLTKEYKTSLQKNVKIGDLELTATQLPLVQ
jgi:hypothetical protein